MPLKHYIIYFSGPITGLHPEEADKRFEDAIAKFGTQKALIEYVNTTRFIFINPLRNKVVQDRLAKRELSYLEIMDKDLALVEIADEVVMLEGWEKSPGATEEHKLALDLKKKITYL